MRDSLPDDSADDVGPDEPDRSALPPEVAALLDFEPVPRQVVRPNGWTPARQRRFIVLLAETGSPRRAAEAMGKELSGVKHVYGDDDVGSFKAAWKAAMELAAARKPRKRARARDIDVPGIGASGEHPAIPGIPADLQELDYREALDQERRAAARWDESIRRIRTKIFHCRRFYLATIADDPERRAAWDLLCGPADWDAARTMDAQPDEDRDPVHLDELKGAGWQVPLKTGFCPELTEHARALAASTLERLEESIRRNDPRWSTERSEQPRSGT